MKTLNATATRIGQSKKETITVGRDTIRKSVDVGKYNFACLLYVGGEELPFIGVSATRENASKWTPGPISRDVYLARKSDTQERKDEVKARYNHYKELYGAPKRISQRGYVFYRFTPSIHRVVLKIERNA